MILQTRLEGPAAWIAAGLIFLAWPLVSGAQEAADASATVPAIGGADNSLCLACHGNEGFAMPDADGQMRSLHVIRDKFEQSVHGKQLCVGCHKDITQIPHQKNGRIKISCVQCHQDLWATAQKENRTAESGNLGVVIQQIDRYMKSIHARPNIEDQSRTNATCYNCHDAHYVYPQGSSVRAEWRLEYSEHLRKVPREGTGSVFDFGARQGSPAERQSQGGHLLGLPYHP